MTLRGQISSSVSPLPAGPMCRDSSRFSSTAASPGATPTSPVPHLHSRNLPISRQIPVFCLQIHGIPTAEKLMRSFFTAVSKDFQENFITYAGVTLSQSTCLSILDKLSVEKYIDMWYIPSGSSCEPVSGYRIQSSQT